MLDDFLEYTQSVRRWGGEVEKITFSPHAFHVLAGEVRQRLDLGLYVGYNPQTGEFFFRLADVLVCTPPNQVTEAPR